MPRNLAAGTWLIAVAGSTLGGVIYGIAFAATGRIWLPLGLHFGWNWAQGPLLGFPLSGGLVRQGSLLHLSRSGPSILTGRSYGPEGGTIGIVGRVVVFVLLLGYLSLCKTQTTRTTATLSPPSV